MDISSSHDETPVDVQQVDQNLGTNEPLWSGGPGCAGSAIHMHHTCVHEQDSTACIVDSSIAQFGVELGLDLVHAVALASGDRSLGRVVGVSTNMVPQSATPTRQAQVTHPPVAVLQVERIVADEDVLLMTEYASEPYNNPQHNTCQHKKGGGNRDRVHAATSCLGGKIKLGAVGGVASPPEAEGSRVVSLEDEPGAR